MTHRSIYEITNSLNVTERQKPASEQQEKQSLTRDFADFAWKIEHCLSGYRYKTTRQLHA